MSYSDNDLVFIAKDSMITTSGYDEQTYLPSFQIQCNNILFELVTNCHRFIFQVLF